MGLFDLFSKGKAAARKRAGHAKELAGDLAGAVEAYVEADLVDEAARVLLVRADAERDAEKKLAFCASAVELATDPALQTKARARKALLGFDLLKGKGGALLTSEVLSLAHELEEAGELERAADAFAMAGDQEGEVRALTAAGAIERLEERLRVSETAVKSENERLGVLRRVSDLDRTAERREALATCDTWLAKHHDEKIAAAAMAIRARLLRGPIIDLVVDGERMRFALGEEITIGRGDATILVGARAVSRQHVRIFRGPSGLTVEDLGTRNGTTLAGARLAGAVAIGDGLTIKLGGEIPCSLSIVPATSAHGPLVSVSVGGDRYLAAIGALTLFGWEIVERHDGGASFVAVRTPAAMSPPIVGEYQVAREVELCAGDALAESRGARPRVVAPGDQPKVEPT